MNILSIDVGIKNLSFCLFVQQEQSTHFKVIKWDNIDISEKTESKCILHITALREILSTNTSEIRKLKKGSCWSDRA